MSTYVHTVPAAARRVLTKACRQGLAPRDWPREAKHLEAVSELAGAPLWVRDPIRKADDARGAAVGRWSLGLWLRGWAEVDRNAVADDVRIPKTPWELLAYHTDNVPRKPTAQRPCWLCTSMISPSPTCGICGGSGVTRRRAPDPPPGWWERRTDARRQCRIDWGLFERLDHPTALLIAKALGCGERSCSRCSRLAQWRAVSRYTPGIAAPLRPGWDREFFTVGSTRPVSTPDEFTAWRSRIAQLQRAMVEGRPEFGIEPGSWEAGITVVEAVPREGGIFAHAHLLLVRRKWYPYGWSMDRIRRGFDVLGLTERQRWTGLGRPRRPALERLLEELPALVAAGDAEARAVLHGERGDVRPPRTVGELLGCRGLQRHLGDLVELGKAGKPATGEVGSHDVIKHVKRGRDGVEIIASYLAKVQAYAAKVDKDGNSPFWDDARAQWILKGVRRCQPWGGFRGLHAGPTRRGWEAYPGATDPRALVGQLPAPMAGPVQPGGPEDGPHAPQLIEGVTLDEPCERFEVHTLSSERIASWRWCHKPRFWQWLRQKKRVRVARPPRRAGLIGLRHYPPGEQVDGPRERRRGGWTDAPMGIDVDAPPDDTAGPRPRRAQVDLFGRPPPD